MKIAVFSDLHLEFGRWEFPKPDVDVCVFAGDIGLGISGIKFIKSIALEHPHQQFIYITGNHDYWGSTVEELNRDITEVVHSVPNLHFLNCNSVVIDGVTFYGGTMWTDMYDHDPVAKLLAPQIMNDFTYIKNFSTDGWLRYHEEFLDGLRQVTGDKIVVVSHHAPCEQSIHPIYKGDTSNAYYYSTLDQSFLPHLDTVKNIPLWIHGHVHHTFDYTILYTRVVCNPRGYIGRERIADGYQVKIVEI